VRDAAYEPVLAALKAKILERYGSPSERPSRHKQLYIAMALGKDEWSRKFRGHTKFSYDEIEWLRRHFEAPPGWPFISWEHAEALRNANEILRRAVQGTAPPREQPLAPDAAASSGHPERQRRGGRK
jgi:hypothetical protein